MSIARIFLLGLAAPLLGACIGENEDVVFVEPSIEAPTASIDTDVLGVTLSGSFRLKLVLGPRASGPSSVQLGSVAITDAANTTSVVPSLSLISSTSFPLDVAVDSETAVEFLFDLENKTLPSETQIDLCLPAGVRIAATIQDSLAAGPTPVASSPFNPTGCM